MSRTSKSLSSTPTLETIILQGAPKAFESVRDEIVAVTTDALVHINLDVPRTARRGLVVAERVKPLFPELSIMSHLDFATVEKLPIYALALMHAHAQAEAPDESKVPLAVLLAEAVPLRADLLQVAEMLAHFGLVSSEQVAFIRRGQGHADTAADVSALGVLLGDAWPSIKGKVVIERKSIDRAIVLGAELQRAIGVRESDEDPLGEPTDARRMRAKAFTLFMAAYDECRRGVSHLRWHEGDATSIVPSLYPRRGVRPRGEEVGGDDVGSELRDGGGVSEPADMLVAAPVSVPRLSLVGETAVDALVAE